MYKKSGVNTEREILRSILAQIHLHKGLFAKDERLERTPLFVIILNTFVNLTVLRLHKICLKGSS